MFSVYCRRGISLPWWPKYRDLDSVSAEQRAAELRARGYEARVVAEVTLRGRQ